MPALVWVVDDSPLDLEHAERALGNEFEVRCFTGGSAVLEQLATQLPPDVIVLDWVMPDVTGIEVIRFMRSGEGRLPTVPVLLLTSRSQPQQIVEGLDAGANDYLAKPYAAQELRARVSSLVRTAKFLERAQSAEATVRALLASAPDALVMVDAQGKLTFANVEAERAFGAAGGALLERSIQEVLPDLPLWNVSVGPDAGLLPLPDVRLGERLYSPSVRFLRDDTAARTTIALRDVTERRRMEARRMDFYSVIAHDLRSPLNSMLLRLELIVRGRRGPLSAELLAELRRFDGTIRSMIRLISDFLDLAKMEGAGYKIDSTPLDLRAVIATTLDEVRPIAEAHAHQLRWAPPAEPALILGDPHRLSQVLSNLLGNALKYTPAEGEIEVRVSPADEHFEVSVRDTGPGIAPEDVPALFDRFTQLPAGDRSPSGWGLGLMIVREIVEAHGGTVGVRSERGRGSTFWFTLPRLARAEARAPAAAN